MKKNLNIAYLNGAEGMIRKGAASSGGSDGGGIGEASTIEYLDISQYTMDDHEKMLAALSFSINTKISGNTAIGLTGYLFMQNSFSSVIENTSYVEIDFNHILAITSNGSFTVKEAIMSYGITQEQLDAIPRITKEEFYSLE